MKLALLTLLATLSISRAEPLRVYASTGYFYVIPKIKRPADKPSIMVEVFCIGTKNQIRGYLDWCKSRHYKVSNVQVQFKSDEQWQVFIDYSINLQQ